MGPTFPTPPTFDFSLLFVVLLHLCFAIIVTASILIKCIITTYCNDFVHLLCFLSCVCYDFVRVCLYVPCGHLLGKS